MSDAYDLRVECPACGAEFAVPAISTSAAEKCPLCGTQVPIKKGASGPALPPLPRLPQDEETTNLRSDTTTNLSSATHLVDALRSVFPETPDGLCYVCRMAEDELPADEIAPIIQSATGLSRYETFSTLHHGMGVIAHVAAHQAQRLSDALEKNGILVFCVACSALPELGPVRRTNRASYDANSLVIQVDYKGTMRSVPWSDVVAVSAGAGEKQSDTVKYGSTSRPVRVTKLKGDRKSYGQHEIEKHEDMLVHVLLKDRARAAGARQVARLEFNHRKLNYECLGQRRSAVSSANFRLFVTDLCQRLTRGFVPLSTQEFISSGKIQKLPHFENRISTDWHHRWLLCYDAALHGPIGNRR